MKGRALTLLSSPYRVVPSRAGGPTRRNRYGTAPKRERPRGVGLTGVGARRRARRLPDVALEQHGPVLAVQRHVHDLPLGDASVEADLRGDAPDEEMDPASSRASGEACATDETPGEGEPLEKRGNVWNEREGSCALEQPLPGCPE
jgi:hypothetical protein